MNASPVFGPQPFSRQQRSLLVAIAGLLLVILTLGVLLTLNDLLAGGAASGQIILPAILLLAALALTTAVVLFAMSFRRSVGAEFTRAYQSLESEVLERKRAEEALRSQNEYFAALNETALGLIGRHNLNELLADILKRAGDLVGTQNGYVFLLDPETGEMVMRVGVGAYQEFVGNHAQRGVALAGKVWQTGEAVNVDDYRNWSGRLADPSRNILRAVVGMPLKRASETGDGSQEEVIGIIGLAHLEPDKRFGPTEMDVLNRFVALAAIALNNTQLYESAERELEQRRSAEKALAYERDLLRALMDNVPDMIFFKDRESRFVRSNPAHLKNLGAASMEEVFGKTDLDFFQSDAARTYVENERRIVETGVPMLNELEAVPLPDGANLYFSSTKVPWRDAEGNIIGTLAISRNITDLVLAEQKLQDEVAERQRTEQFLDSIVENLPTMLFVKDAQNLQFVRWNKAAETITGRALSDMLGKNDYDLFPKDEADFFVSKDRETLNGSQVLDIPEEPIANASGEIRWLHTKKFRVMGADGKPAYLVGISEDITERKRAEQEVREAREFLETLVNNIPLGIFVKDAAELRMVRWNKANEVITGIPAAQVMGKTDHDLFPKEIADAFVANDRATLASGQLWDTPEEPIQTAERGLRYLHTKKIPLNDATGKPAFLLGISEDVTERKRADDALRESEERYRDLFENANDLIQSISVDGRFLFVNQAWKNTLGYDDQDIANMRFVDVVHPDGRADYFEQVEKVLRGETVSEMTAQLLTKDRRKVWVEGSVSPRMVDNKVVSTRAIFRNVTERRLAEEQAAFQNALLNAQNDVSPDGILVIGNDDRVLSFNKRFVELWNIPPEALADGNAEAMREAVRAQLANPDEWVTRTGAIYMQQDKSSHDEINFKDGRVFERYSAPVKNAEGAYLGRVWFFHDVTEIKRAEQEVRRIVESAAAVFWRSTVTDLHDETLDARGYHWETYVSNFDSLSRRIPLRREPGQSDLDAWYFSWLEQDRELMNVRSSSALRNGQDSYQQEFRLRDANGKLHWMYEDARITRVDPDHFEVVGVTIDITDRKQAEEELQYERYLLDSLMDNLPHYIYFKDTESRFTRINRAQAAHLGLEHPSEALGKSDFDFYSQEHARPAYEDEQTIIRTGEPIINKEELETYPDGTKRWASATKLPLRRGGEIIGTFGISLDITEQKLAEEALRANETLYHSLVETIPQSLTRKDREGRVTFGNTRFFEDTGKGPADLYGKTDFDFHPRELAEKYWQDDLRVLRDGETIDTIEPHERGDGTRITVHVLKTPIRNHLGEIDGMQIMFWDITEEQRRQEEIRKQNAYLNALQETSLGLMQRLDVNALLEDIVARAGALVGTENGYVFLRDADFEEMEMRVGVGAYEGFVGRRTRIGVGLAGQVWESGAPIVVDDYRNFGGRLADASRDILRAVAGVPLRSGSEVIGVIGLAFLDEEHKFGPAEIQVLERFAQLATIALDNARLYETAQEELAERSRVETALAQQLRETELLNRVTNHAVSLDVDTALGAICRELAQYFGVEQSGIALLSEDGETLTVVADYSPHNESKVVGYVIPVKGNPSTEIVLQTRRAVAFADAQTDPRLAPIHDLMKTRDTASILIAPLFVRDEIIGTLGIDSTTRREFLESEVALVQRIALSISTALENARLFRAAQQELAERRRVEQEMRQRNQELEVISRVSAVMTTNIDMITALETLARELVQTFRARNCGIALLNNDKTSLTVVADALSSEHEEHAVGIVIPLEGNLSSQYVVENRRSLVIPDAQTDPMTEPIHERMRQRQTKCLAIIPLMSGGEVIGTIGLDTTDPNHVFSDEEIRLAETMANQMANAIEKQRLFDQTKERARREQLTREIGAHMTRSLDLEQILQTTARELSQALGASHAVVRMGAGEMQSNGGNGHS